jgi:hypothetical protein
VSDGQLHALCSEMAVAKAEHNQPGAANFG